MSSPILNIDMQAWDPASPVLLPLGPVTVAPIFAASMGVLVPFIIFTMSLFTHMLSEWHGNLTEGYKALVETMERPKFGIGGALAAPWPLQQL